MIRNREQLIRNGWTTRDRRARRLCLDALQRALNAVNPYHCVLSRVKIREKKLLLGDLSVSLPDFQRIVLLSVGKASSSMMAAGLRVFRGFPVHGILVAPVGHKIPKFPDIVEVFHTGHPIPDLAGIKASRRVKELVSGLREVDLLVCLISGGASALLPAPVRGIALSDLRKTTQSLIASTANIHEINTVRRHISDLKGGRLVDSCKASRILSLIVSDVPGNSIPDIGSGLTSEDPTSFADATNVLKEHGLWNSAPSAIRHHLMLGLRGAIPETPKPGDPRFRHVSNFIIADNGTASTAAARALALKQLPTTILTTSAEMDAESMGRFLVSVASENRHRAFIVGGETTVHVAIRGVGGRNQHTALSSVEGLSNLDGACLAALASDGVDGTSSAAGAIVDGRTASRAEKKRLDPRKFLTENDSYRFFKALRDNITTGPTGTNVGDIYLAMSL